MKNACDDPDQLEYPCFLDSEVPPAIELNEGSCFLSEEDSWHALAHEGTHALEYMAPVTFSVTSSPWHEGFAEMIPLPIMIARFSILLSCTEKRPEIFITVFSPECKFRDVSFVR